MTDLNHCFSSLSFPFFSFFSFFSLSFSFFHRFSYRPYPFLLLLKLHDSFYVSRSSFILRWHWAPNNKQLTVWSIIDSYLIFGITNAKFKQPILKKQLTDLFEPCIFRLWNWNILIHVLTIYKWLKNKDKYCKLHAINNSWCEKRLWLT
jgi:hypothetical protein